MASGPSGCFCQVGAQLQLRFSGPCYESFTKCILELAYSCLFIYTPSELLSQLPRPLLTTLNELKNAGSRSVN